MKKQGFIIAILLSAFLGSLQAAGTSAAQFLKLGAGARAASLGDSYVSVADDSTAAYWNPAGLAQLKAAEVSLMQNSYLEDTQYQFISAVRPVGRSVLGLSVYRLDYGSIEGYDVNNAQTNDFDAGSLAVAFSFAREIRENLLLGVNAKYVSESIENESGSSFAGDFGLLYKKGSWNYGLALQHVGPGIKMVQESYKLPQTVRAGVSRLFRNDKLLVTLGVSKPNDNDVAINGGTEFKISKIVALRAGYSATPGNSLDVDGVTGVTGGLGFQLGRLGLDYAIAPFGDLGAAHRVSLRFSFDSVESYR